MVDTLLGIDIGTTSTKAVLFDLSGQTLLAAEQSYRLLAPQPGWVEQDPEEVWQALLAVLRTVVEQAGAGRRILALCLAAQCGSVIPAAADSTPVYPMITWMDGRTEALVREWRAEGREPEVRRISGWLLHPGLPLPAIAWLRRFRPDVFAAAERYLGINDFLTYRLAGRFCTNPSSGAEMQLVDVNTGRWSQALCDLAGIRPEQLSSLEPSGAVIGPIRPDISRLTGLPVGTPVVNGGHDQCCSALAMGMTAPGKVMLACGTAWVITAVVDSPDVAAVPAGMDLNFHVLPQRWTISQLLGGLGASLEWWLQTHNSADGRSRADMYAALNETLRQSEPGCHGLLFVPLTGAAQVPAGVQHGGFIGLRLDHNRADMARAILEGAAFELRWALEQIWTAGLPVERLWLVGGATRSPVWPQILADASGVPFSVTDYAHWPALGAAILAGAGAGVFESAETGQARLRQPAREVLPNPAAQAIYQERFAAYKQVAGCLAGVGT